MTPRAAPWGVWGLVSVLALAACLDVAKPPRAPEGELGPWEPVWPSDMEDRGSSMVGRLFYEFAPEPVQDAVTLRTTHLPIRGFIHFPRDVVGSSPVALLVHGAGAACEPDTTSDPGGVSCPVRTPEGPWLNFEGFDYLAQDLASHGYVVVSIDAQSVEGTPGAADAASAPEWSDGGEMARARLVLRTLDEMQRINQPSVPLRPYESHLSVLQGRLDLGSVGLVGHSRGGEGVIQAATLVAQGEGGPGRVRAVFAIAPTDDARLSLRGVPLATLLPYCDGDVTRLEGAALYDRARYADPTDMAPKHQILVLGANHNFYNMLWTEDDATAWLDDAYCGPSKGPDDGSPWRWGPADQQAHASVFIAAFIRQYVGLEPGLDDWLSGRFEGGGVACDASVPGCGQAFHVSYHPSAAHRLVLEDTLDALTLMGNDLGGSVTFTGFDEVRVCPAEACSGRFVAGEGPYLRLSWSAPATYVLEVPPDHQDVRAFHAFTFRAGVEAAEPEFEGSAPSPEITVTLTDRWGASSAVDVALHSAAVFSPPGDGPQVRKTVLNMVRLPLQAFGDIDLGSLAAVEIRLASGDLGALLLTDLMFQA